MDNTAQSNGRDPREVVTQQTYDRVAAKYAHTRCGKGAWQAELALLWEMLGRAKGKKRLLDLGCGTGRVLQHALTEGKPLKHYVGVDYSKPMLDQALQWSVATKVPFLCHRHENLRFLEQPMHRLRQFLRPPKLDVHLVAQEMQQVDPPTSYFDAITLVASLHHLLTRQEQETALELCFHTLKPGGLLFLTNWRLDPSEKVHRVAFRVNDTAQQDRYYYAFTEDELSELLRYAGFNEITHHGLDGGRNIVTTARKERIL